MKYPHKCPLCGRSAYIGLAKALCVNTACSNFDPSIKTYNISDVRITIGGRELIPLDPENPECFGFLEGNKK